MEIDERIWEVIQKRLGYSDEETAVSWVLRERLLCGKRSGHIRTR